MTTTHANVLVLKDQAGDYFLVPEEVLEQGRVPEEHKGEVERLVGEARADDTTGQAAFIAGMVAGTWLSAGVALAMSEYYLNNQDLSGVIQSGAAWAQSQLQR